MKLIISLLELLFFASSLAVSHAALDENTVADLETQMINQVRDNRDVTLQRAKNGNPESQYRLALFYRDGLFGKETGQYIEWLNKSAAQGNKDAMYELGHAFYLGKNVTTDKLVGVKWWEKAADLEHEWALYNLGSVYREDTLYNKDVAKAIRLYQRSFKAGNAAAAAKIGEIYLSGDGEFNNPKKAFSYYCISASSGDEIAQEIMGDYYYGRMKTDFIEIDTETALYWYLNSSLNGHARSIKFVSEYYLYGIEPLEKDLGKATAWLAMAKYKGEKSVGMLSKLRSVLDEKMLKTAKEKHTEIKSKLAIKGYKYTDLVDLDIPIVSCSQDEHDDSI